MGQFLGIQHHLFHTSVPLGGKQSLRSPIVAWGHNVHPKSAIRIQIKIPYDVKCFEIVQVLVE